MILIRPGGTAEASFTPAGVRICTSAFSHEFRCAPLVATFLRPLSGAKTMHRKLVGYSKPSRSELVQRGLIIHMRFPAGLEQVMSAAAGRRRSVNVT